MCSTQPFSRWRVVAFAAILLMTAAIPTAGQVSVTTYQYNNQRTGVNGNESILMPSNVNPANFGQLFTQPVDGSIYGQPLYVPGLTINGTVHNVVYVATENDSVFAFDADSNTGANAQPLWKASFLPSGATPVSDNLCTDITPEYGITGTPVIDPSTNTLYAVGETLENNTYVKRLHAINITTGAEQPGSPIVITASVTVPGQSAVTFDTEWENQRGGLLFYNGVVYIGFGSHCDGGNWRGWILGYSYNGSSLTQSFVFCTEPSSVNGSAGGIWNSGQGLPMDTGSNLFVSSGNGQFDTNVTPPINYGDSIVRLDLSQGPAVQDYFAPSIEATLDSQNQDMGSGGIAILPDQPGPYPHLAVTADKYQTIYVVNRDNLGQFHSSGDMIVQELSFGSARMFSSPIYFSGKVYFSGANDVVRAYTMTNGLLSISSTDQAGDLFSYPGSVPTISANGTSNAILWTLKSAAFSTSGPAVLYAYDPTNLAAGSLYNSNQNPSRDNPGGAIKFAVPTVANGKVYVGAAGQLSVYGELASTGAPTITSASSTTFTVGTSGSFTITTTGTPTPTLTETGTLPTGVTFSSSNGTGTLSGTPAAGSAGSYPLTFAANNGVGTAASQSFTLTVNQASQAPTITSASSTTFTVGTSGSFTITTTGTPTPTLTETGTLPTGVTFSSSNGTGTLSGTPAAGSAGSYPLTFAANNGVGTAASQSFTLTVNQASQAPTITSASSTTFTVGTSGSFTITTTGTPTPTLTETGTLPTGVTFSSSNGTGTLSGTPAAGSAGSYPLTFVANNGVGTAASQSFTLTVNSGVTGTAPSITSASSTTFTVGTSGSFTITTTGTPTPTLTEAGTLPTGVTFSSSNGTGTLSGTPAAGSAGSYPLTFVANNGVGTAASQSFTLTISGSGSGSVSWGQMDAWLQMNTSTPGTTLTASIVAAGTVGGVLPANNFGETGDAGTPSGNANIVLATPFVTGSDANGYTSVSVSGYNGGVSAAANFDLGIYADSRVLPAACFATPGQLRLLLAFGTSLRSLCRA